MKRVLPFSGRDSMVRGPIKEPYPLCNAPRLIYGLTGFRFPWKATPVIGNKQPQRIALLVQANYHLFSLSVFFDINKGFSYDLIQFSSYFARQVDSLRSSCQIHRDILFLS